MEIRRRGHKCDSGELNERSALLPHSSSDGELETRTISRTDNSGLIGSFLNTLSLCAKSIWTFLLPTFETFTKLLFSALPTKLTDAERELLEAFKTFAVRPYDPQKPEHQVHLERLWCLTFPEIDFVGAVSPKWKDLGFQQSNPASDFRGAGIFGLRNLIHFCERYPFHVQRMVRERTDSKEQYPWAIAGLNVTMMLFQFLGWGFKPHFSVHFAKKLLSEENGAQSNAGSYRPPAFDENDDDLPSPVLPAEEARGQLFFAEFFCFAFLTLHNEWYESSATYMQFPLILAKAEQRLLDHVTKIKNTEELIRMNTQIELM